MVNPVISKTQPDDVPGLRDVLDQTRLFPSEILASMLAPALAGDADALWLTCHLDGKAVGSCFSEPEGMTDGTWNMRALAVRPDMQGRGLGAALVAGIEDHLRKTGQRILIVDTSGADEFALTRKFYAQNGYEEEARIRDFWADGDDKVTFRKSL